MFGTTELLLSSETLDAASRPRVGRCGQLHTFWLLSPRPRLTQTLQQEGQHGCKARPQRFIGFSAGGTRLLARAGTAAAGFIVCARPAAGRDLQAAASCCLSLLPALRWQLQGYFVRPWV